MRSILDCRLGETCWESRGGPVSWSRRSDPHVVLPADRNAFPLSTCQPSAAASRPRPLPVRAGIAAPFHVKAVLGGVASEWGHARFSLDMEWYDWHTRTGGSVFQDGHIQDMSSM
jgi:hypothetical protein